MKVSTLVDFFDRLYPFALAEEWDNVGLIVGDSKAEVTGVALCLDVTHNVLDEAIENGCNVVVTHHPVIFRAIKRLNAGELQGGLVAKAFQHGISLVALHTNLDSAVGGLNDTLSELFGLREVKPLVDSGRERFYKLAVFVPPDHAEKVREAMCAQGAGVIGDYEHCSFSTPGEGSFRGVEGRTNPFTGTPGTLEKAGEVKLEVMLRREIAGRVISAMIGAHPYEEVAHDLIPLHNKEGGTGLARIAKCDETTLDEFVRKVQGLGILVTRVMGDPQKPIKRVALCSGAGSDFTGYAISQGADVYLTAELKHHHGLAADQRGMALIETDHYTLEQKHWPKLAALLKQQYPDLKTKVSERGPSLWRGA
ncbi:MAG: Nif3-like dinuclear metal center hexameric protein [Planctomycetes bacterium]|nr:Nif3-like dinuclear metal center hexameric protein [Planctomycetota bacterium]